MWFSEFFLHPGMAAAGAGLISVPIIIHLLNRLRYRTVRFAAMEFLLESEEQNKRRMLIEQLLLLLLRILIVLLIAALFARLILDPSAMAMLEKPETHHLIVLDDSGSMQDRWGETSAYGEALETMKRLISDLANEGGNHTVTLLQTSHPDRSAASLTRRRVDMPLVSELEDRLETMEKECGYGRADWSAIFPAVERQLAADESNFQVVHVLSDFRANEWGESPTLQDDFERLSGEERMINLVPCVPAQHRNLAVTNLEGALHTAAVGVPLELTAKVTNASETVRENVPIRLLVDEEAIPQSISIPQIDAGETVQERFEVVLSSAGEHAISVQLPSDSLAIDNTRHVTVNVPERQRVLIADGSEGTREAGYVADALAAEPNVTGFDAVIVRPDGLREQDLDEYAAVYMLNIGRLPPDVLRLVQDYVHSGGGVAWFMGNQIDTSFYNELASQVGKGEDKDGESESVEEEDSQADQEASGVETLFPVSLGSSPASLPPVDPTNPASDMQLEEHPLFSLFNASGGLLSNFVKIQKYYPLAESSGEIPAAVRVIGRLRNQDPLFLETRHGQGRIFISLTSAGPMSRDTEQRWHNWPFDVNAPGFTVFHLELAKRIADPTRSRPSSLVNEPLIVEINPAVDFPEVRFTPPEQTGLSPLTIPATPPETTGEKEGDNESSEGENGGESEEENGNATLFAELTETRVPGIYRIVTEDLSRNSRTTLAAYNIPVSESEMAITSPAEFRRELTGIPDLLVQDFGNLEGLARDDPGRELRMTLLLLLAGLLIAEQGLAYRLGFHERSRSSKSGASVPGPIGRRFGQRANQRASVSQEVV